MQTLVLIGALAVGGLFLYAVFAQSWRMLARKGVAMSAAEASAYEMALATRRCVACADKAQCDTWLAAHRREGFEGFCPNASLIERCARR